MLQFNIDQFISAHVTCRPDSMFRLDVAERSSELQERLDGQSALVIGGAGSIGSAFIKALLKFKISRLVVVDLNENNLTELTRDLRSSAGINIPGTYKTYPMNFGDTVFQRLFLHEASFDIVANFAAHKHVRSEKDQYSIAAMVENNVLRNHALIELLADSPPQHFFCVSTDKAANPANVMGATKKLMEELLFAYSEAIPVATARFANVAFSQGSLLDGFLHRIQKQQPLSAPRNVRRYFVSPQESGELCLLACVLGSHCEIFFPKLAEKQMNSFDVIAEHLLRALGREPKQCSTEEQARERAATQSSDCPDWPVHFFETDTSGEKPYEEFYCANEQPDLRKFHGIGVLQGKPTYSRSEFREIIEKLRRVVHQSDVNKTTIIEFLKDVLPTFQHIETGKSLDQRM